MKLGRSVSVGGLIGLSLALGGCANWNTAFRTFDVNKGQSISIDAKQRVIYSVLKDFGPGKEWYAVCAEPSPDALSALSASLGLDAASASKSLGLAFASQEGAASIGLRTQTIQTLRDSMYRLCEGYASGAIDDIGFTRLQRRYQAVMLGLLAIEQLTGAVVAQQAAMGGNSGARLGQSLAKLSVLVTEARTKSVAALAALEAGNKAVDDAKKQVAAKKAELEAVPATAEQTKKDAATQAYATAQQALAQAEAAQREAALADTVAKADLESLETLRKELDRAAAVASTTATLAPAGAGSASDPSDQVAQRVAEIVKGVVEFDYTRETCLDTITSRGFRNAINPPDGKEPSKGALDLATVQLHFCAFAIEQASLTRLAQDRRLTPDVGASVAKSTTQLLERLSISKSSALIFPSPPASPPSAPQPRADGAKATQ